MKKGRSTRRSGIVIMAKLLFLLGSLSYIMILAVINGSLGFICAMGITILGSLGVAKALGEVAFISYKTIIILTLMFGVLRGILRYLEQYLNHYIAFRLLAVLRDKIFTALRILSPAKLETKKKGSIISMITADIETLEVFYAHTISPIFIAIIVSLSVFLFVGFYSSWYLAIVALFGFLVIGIIIPIKFSKILKSSGVKYRREFSHFSAYFLDSIKGIKDIILNNDSEKRENSVNIYSQKLIDEMQSMKSKTAKSSSITDLVVSLIALLAVAVGVFLVINGIIPIGRMIVGVVAILGSFGPVLAISSLPSNLTQTFASGDRVLNLLEETPVVNPITNGENFSFNILKINNLSFSYEKDETKNILSNINISINEGKIIGIVGSSGCGKSTLLKLIMRFWEKDKGSITFNGIDIDSINTKSLLNNVTMVSQTTYLFDDTIEQNLRIAKPNATNNEIVEACKKAAIHDFIMTKSDGYQSKIGFQGCTLSAGEKQRLALARAFLRGSKLILLDEPTSNVDSINEKIILNAIKNQKTKNTFILVSHRESTMSIADSVYRMENGEISEYKSSIVI